ncbi:MAG: protein-L-isoaspartate(D-aspartate) O-methyltransferase [Acidobacteriota bacterium]
MNNRLFTFIFSQVLLIAGCCLADDIGTKEAREARMKMVEQQIAARGVTDERVLEAMRKVERHQFVPDQYRAFAYSDRPLPIGEGQTISQPYVVAFMTEILELQKGEKVLEIGTGSGYQAAVLAEICNNVWTIEVNQTLADRARKVLEKTGYTDVHVRAGDGYLGWKEPSPFDAIIVTCAPSDVPETLLEQLSEGGRMIIPVDSRFGQELVLLKKVKGELVRTEVLPVRFVPMINEDGVKY